MHCITRGPLMTELPAGPGKLMTIRREFYTAALLTVGLLCAGAAPAAAEFRVLETGPDTLVIEARNATVHEILEALSESRTFQFRSSDALSQIVTGTYSGTLPRVLSRILDGRDHVIQSTPSGVRLTVLGDAHTVGTMSPATNAAAPNIVRAASSKPNSNGEIGATQALRP